MWLRRCVVGALLLTVADAIVVGSAPSARVVALGDVHGDFQQTVRVLKMARVIDNQHRWIGGDTTLVQLGDILDRGTEERELWDFFLRLRDEAPLAGGKVVQLLGNHEVLNVLGQAGNYVHPEGYMQFGEDRCAAFMPGSEYATPSASTSTITPSSLRFGFTAPGCLHLMWSRNVPHLCVAQLNSTEHSGHW